MNNEKKPDIFLNKLINRDEFEILNIFIEKSMENWKEIQKNKTIIDTYEKAKIISSIAEKVESSINLDEKDDDFVINISVLKAGSPEEAEKISKELILDKLKHLINSDDESESSELINKNVLTLNMTKAEYIETRNSAFELIEHIDFQNKMIETVDKIFNKLSTIREYYNDENW